MKLSCEIVKDLLPLYEDGLCSRESRAAVEEHLEQCTSCAGECGRVRALEIPEIDLPKPKQEKAVAKSFRKVRRRWVASVLLVIVLLPLLTGLGWLGWNQYREEGICYTNLDEIALASDFVKLLEKGKYEQAAAYLDHTGDYESIHEVLGFNWEDYLPDLQQVQIGEEIWLADPEFAERYLRDTHDSRQVWSNLIYNGADVALIPVDIFKTITDQSPSEGHWEDTIYYTGNGYEFASFQTQWGSFMAERNCWRELTERLADPVMLCYLLELYPLQMYQDTLPQLEADAKEQWQSGQDWNMPYQDMSYEEYAAGRNEEFIREMEALAAQGLRVEYKGVWDAYRVEKEWVIETELLVRKGSETAGVVLHLSVKDGRLHMGAAHHMPNTSEWIDDLLNAFT